MCYLFYALSILGKTFCYSADILTYFSQEIGFETYAICMKCQILFSGKKIRKKDVNLLSAELAHSDKGNVYGKRTCQLSKTGRSLAHFRGSAMTGRTEIYTALCV